ncbi:MAG: 3-deoxy-D-manno-octulosonic acid transferase [Proteobacteria bacterium]|nr:3-deoxy-D-manno-octulosonic acid transferase [Pseudomonadota bacterium]
MSLPPGLLLYRFASYALTPFAPILLRKRLQRGKEDAARLNERLGHPTYPRPEGPLVWLHGASVGETVSLLPLVAEFQARGLAVMLTTGTVTSAALAAQRLPAGAFHQFIPVDLPGATERFIAHFRPDLGLIAESEVWPNLILAAARAEVPLAIVNGRMSERSRQSWSRLRGTIRTLLARFTLVLAQSEADATRYRALGAADVRCPGNLKFDVAPLGADPAEHRLLAETIGARPVFIAASTHPGEEEIVVGAHLAARHTRPGLLTIIAPRHPERGASLRALATTSGLAAAQRSLGEAITATTDLYIADTIGELGLIYRLGGFAFLGGSFISHGGQNPIEPAKLGLGVLHGPHVFNFTDVYAAFDEAGGALCVSDPDDLAGLIIGLITDTARLSAMQDHARDTAERFGGAKQRIFAALAPLLPVARDKQP